MTEIQILYIIIFLMALSIAYLYYKTTTVSENFDSTSVAITKAVNDQYKMDIDAIRNLGQISGKIMENPDNLILPANISIPKELNVKGNLKVDGDVVFTNKNTNVMELFPRYMIIALSLPPVNANGNTNVPKGWAICDGRSYSIGTDGHAIYDPNNGILTPDLKGRFILGVGAGDGLTERKFTDPKGGEENHELTIHEMPSHNHAHYFYYSGLHHSGGPTEGQIMNNGASVFNSSTKNTGGVLKDGTGNKLDGASIDNKDAQGKDIPAIFTTTPHNNMPPYYILTYIMKL